jgi:hypothetical protein
MTCTSDEYLEPLLLILLWLLLLLTKQWARIYHILELTLSSFAETALHTVRQNASDIREWRQKKAAVASAREETSTRGVNVSASQCMRDAWQAAVDWEYEGDAEPRPSPFYWTMRSFKRFCQKNPHGLLSQDCKRFDAPAPTFYHLYSSNSYWHLFKHLAGGVIANTWRHAVMSALWAGLLEWAYFHVKCRDPDTSLRVRNGLFGVISVHEALLPLVSFLLTVYVTGRMKKHTEIIYSAWSMRGKMNCLAMFVGGVVNNNTHTNLHFKHKLFRWLCMLHFYVYQNICNHLSAYHEFHWHSKGMLSLEEAKALARTPMKVELIFAWLTTLCHAGPQNTSERQRVELLRLTCQIREAYAELKDICAWIPPISEAQLLAVIVEFFIAITPMALVMQNSDAGAPAYVWGMTGSAFLGLFFVGLLNMVRIVEDPFGEDLDDLNPDALLWTTEKTLQAYLVSREAPTGLIRKARAGFSFQDAMFHARHGRFKESDLYLHVDGSELVDGQPCSCSLIGPPFQVLTIQVYTGDIMFAGTDAAVWIQLYGSDDEPSPKFMLDRSETNENPFENGSLDVFSVPYSFNEITKIDIGHEGGGQAQAWYLAKVVIQSSIAGKLWEFEANEWIDISKTDLGWRTYLPNRQWLPPAPWPAVQCSAVPTELAPRNTGSMQTKSVGAVYTTQLRTANALDSDKQSRNSSFRSDSSKKIKKSQVLPEPMSEPSQQQWCSTEKSQHDTQPIESQHTRDEMVPKDAVDKSKVKTEQISTQIGSYKPTSVVAPTMKEAQQLQTRVTGLHSQLAALVASKQSFDSQVLALLKSIEANTRPLENMG